MAFSAVTERGSGVVKAAGTTVTMNPSANLTVGKIVFAFMVGDNTATTTGASTTHSSMADTDGNTWNKVWERTMTAGAASDGSTASLWWAKVATQIDTTDTITGTMASTTAKVLMVWEVTIGSGTIQVVASGETFLETNGANPAALTLAGLASKEYLFLGTMGAEEEQTTWTEEATFTNVFAAEGITTGPGGVPASNQTGFAAYRIATDTGASFDIAYATSEKELALTAFEEVTSGVTGTVAVTLADFTSAATGVETITGTVAVTLGDATSAASGTVANPVTGTVAVTLADFTSTASGTVQVNVTGSVAVTLGDATSAASGTVTINITGSAAVTLDNFTSSAAAIESMSGTVAVTLANFTSAATGAETITGSAAVTLADATSTASGTETITGSSAVMLADFTSAGVGNVTVNVTGTVAVVLEDFVSAATGTVVSATTVVLPVSAVIGDADREGAIGNGDRAGVLTSGNRTGTIR